MIPREGRPGHRGRTDRAIRRTGPAVAAALVLLAALLAGCSSSGSGPAASPESAPGSSTPPLASSGTTTPAAPPGVSPSAVTTVPPGHDGSLDGVHVTLTKVAVLRAPIALVQRPHSSDLYVAERGGTVVRLTPNPGGGFTRARPAVLDIAEEVGTSGEEGLLGLAFGPDGTNLYVSYATPQGVSRVDTYEMKGTRADPSTQRNLLSVNQAGGRTIHKGGDLKLGPDGKLWLGLGDGGPEGDPDDTAQNPKLMLGKMLKIDRTTGKVTVWASGLRNPWRFSFDPATGDVWIGDVGQDTVEEIDRLPAATPPGANFGWSGFEGTNVFSADRVPARSVAPLLELRHPDGWCAVIGGVVVHDKALPKLSGAYVFGDLCRHDLSAIRVENDTVTAMADLGVNLTSLEDISVDAAGHVYLLTLAGALYRLSPNGT